ncbi:MAG: hypothetical protein A2156_00935 [Deltaproteobacteria bacterium RBG_16_48_10]|nr:MAG: hypothetical protein A2156_00935 [Deltaproteobacteria bacterium RBG_16_48_10]
MLNLFQHLVKVFSAFGRHTFHPRPQDGVFRCDSNKMMPLCELHGSVAKRLKATMMEMGILKSDSHFLRGSQNGN